MSKANWWAGIIVCVALLSTGCQHRREHTFSPRQAATEQDSLAMEELLDRQKKAIEAENVVIGFVKADSARRWVQHEFGWWYSYIHRDSSHDETKTFYGAMDSCCSIHETVYDLQDRMIVDAVRCFVPENDNGQDDAIVEPFAYRFMLSELVEGDTVMMVIPWYMGYGYMGSNHVPPYTNIRVLLTLHGKALRDVTPIDDAIDTPSNKTNTDKL